MQADRTIASEWSSTVCGIQRKCSIVSICGCTVQKAKIRCSLDALGPSGQERVVRYHASHPGKSRERLDVQA